MKRTLSILAVLAACAAGGWYLTKGNDAAVTTGTGFVGAAVADTAAADVDTSGILEMEQGNPDAAVTLIEYASFTCPHCAAFHEGPLKQLKADYIDTDQIRFIYREVYFDRFGLWASMVARCGGAEKFFGISDLIYKTQSDWVRAGEPAAIIEELRKIGRLAGIDNDQLDVCLKDADQATALVAWFEANAKADEITSTPSFLINGKKYSNMSYDDMKGLIDAALAE